MRNPEQILGWFAVSLLCLALAGIGAGIIYFVVGGIRESIAKDRCGEIGGKVEFYNADHPRLWRCVGALPESR